MIASRRNLAVYATLAAVGCAIDLWTKNWIFAKLGMRSARDGSGIWMLGGYFGLDTNLNEGALFGMGQGQASLFAALSVLAFVGVLYWLFAMGGRNELLLCISLGCITAGILGNLYDRLGLHGLRWTEAYAGHQPGDPVHAVRDWLHFKINAWNYSWPIFNIADSLLVCGAGLLVFKSLTEKPPVNSSMAS